MPASKAKRKPTYNVKLPDEKLKLNRYRDLVRKLFNKHLQDPYFYFEVNFGVIFCGFERPFKKKSRFRITVSPEYYYIYDGERIELKTVSAVMQYIESEG